MGAKLVMEYDAFSALILDIQNKNKDCVSTNDTSTDTSVFPACQDSQESFKRREKIIDEFNSSLTNSTDIILKKMGVMKTKDDNLSKVTN